MAESCKKLHML
jgi:hypothetical protein